MNPNFITSIYQKISEVSSTNPDKTAFFQDDKKISYVEFKKHIDYVSYEISMQPPYERIGLLVNNSMQGYSCIYACALAGITYVPIPPNDPIERKKKMLETAEIKFLLVEESLLEEQKEALQFFKQQLQVRFLVVKNNLSTAPAAVVATTVKQTEKPLYMLFTSGSTGTPKGVLISHPGVKNFLDWAGAYFDISEKDIFLAHPPLTFDLSVFAIYLPFMHAGCVNLVKNFQDQVYPGALMEKACTILLTAPRITALLYETGYLSKKSFPNLRHFLFCGEKLHAQQVMQWFEKHDSLTIHNLYGPTEATVACTYYSIKPQDKISDPIPIGKPIPNMDIYFSQESGEAVICGIGVSQHDYVGQVTDKFFNHPQHGRSYKTGDIIGKNADGNLFWQSRLDDQIKIRGNRVELSEIESIYFSHAIIKECACIFDQDNQQLVLVYSLKNQATVDTEEELKFWAEQKLPYHMRPAQFIRMDKLPLDKNGKVDKKQIKKLIQI